MLNSTVIIVNKLTLLLLFLLFWSGLLRLATTVDLKYALERYEIVEMTNWPNKRIYKRSNNYVRSEDRNEIIFYAFDRQFRLFLRTAKGILASTFKAEVIDKLGQSRFHYVNEREFYHGTLDGEPHSTVNAHVDEYGAVTGSIWTKVEIYNLEPAWRHLNEASPSATIVYRASDVKSSDNLETAVKFCQADWNDSWSRMIEKRQAPSPQPLTEPVSWTRKNRCSLKLIADYRFHREIGGSSTATTIRYLISLIDRVNSIYTQTVWKDVAGDMGFDNVGFVIKTIIVHVSPSEVYGHYNSDAVGWEVGSLLQRFSEAEGSAEYCLAHLFTAQPFSGGVLGLGYIASPKLGTSGGICSTAALIRNKHVYFNTALSSVRSSYGGPVVTREADIVTAHEFGHNWGSPHDPVSNECSPSIAGGGPYIMFTYSVSGYDHNNKLFSPCSRRSIKAVLQAKSHFCFMEEERTFCGNQLVEPGEDCDVGLSEHGDVDPCCTMDCKLKENAKCSPLNSPCCSNSCQFLNKGVVCRQHFSNPCKRNSHCDGHNGDCPAAVPAEDGTPCMDDGECQMGECMSFCERRDIAMKPCICENKTLSCLRCCRSPNSNNCTPFTRMPMYPVPKVLADGTRCIHGYCVGGNCKREVQDLVEHIWDIIDKLDINAILKFMRNNIVSTVAMSTLIFWIPASLLINSMDQEKSMQRDQEMNWVYPDSMADNERRIRMFREVHQLSSSVRC